jgi:catalase (peroxidase I)
MALERLSDAARRLRHRVDAGKLAEAGYVIIRLGWHPATIAPWRSSAGRGCNRGGGGELRIACAPSSTVLNGLTPARRTMLVSM